MTAPTDQRPNFDETVALQTKLLMELEPVVEANLERHLAASKPWMPHDYIPWSQGKDFGLLGGDDWTPQDSKLDATAKAAMVLNLLTEDNLPCYHREIAERFTLDGPWGTWVGRWTAEEARHSMVMRDYLVVTRGVDPVKLETMRMDHMTAGYVGPERTMLRTVAYVSFQELATRISHRNTGHQIGCPIAERMLARVAQDENLHMVFYRNLLDAAFDIAPDDAIEAIRDELIGFQMPGTGMPDFARNSLAIAKAGIYDLNVHFEEVVQPVLRFWKTFDRSDYGPRGRQALDELSAFLETLRHDAAVFVEKRAEAEAKKARRAEQAGV